MKRLAWVQVCTWAGLFCMWLYFPVAVARNVFGAPNESSPLYQSGVEWGKKDGVPGGRARSCGDRAARRRERAAESAVRRSFT